MRQLAADAALWRTRTWARERGIGLAYDIINIIMFTGFPAGTVQIRGHEQLQQKISDLSVLVALQMVITSYHFAWFTVPPEKHLETCQISFSGGERTSSLEPKRRVVWCVTSRWSHGSISDD